MGPPALGACVCLRMPELAWLLNVCRQIHNVVPLWFMICFWTCKITLMWTAVLWTRSKMCLKLQIYSLTCRCCIYLGSLLGFVAGFMGFFPFCLYHTVQIIVTLWYVLMYCLLITFLLQSFLAVLMGNAFFFWLTYLYTVELTPCSVHFYGFWQMFEIVYPATMAHDSKLLQVALL